MVLKNRMKDIVCYCDASFNESEKTCKAGMIIAGKKHRTVFKNVFTSTHAELLALRETLLIINKDEINHFTIKIDDRGIVRRLDDGKSLKGENREIYRLLMKDIRRLLKETESRVIWIKRNKNKADKLTR
ncbi:ribonuclease H-like domain-containing protein [Cytobacillus kochii]|uniref:ribonuclease H family protein n=1 Tax=Cytobacillus kochii TaxID=859143 RepID=UPI001CD6FC63|nr:ribonuclease H family protein [Cytobacillus kochii]MCA1026991.1 ribonuclease H-like domain-containing protein [Cytobacillus kochii]